VKRIQSRFYAILLVTFCLLNCGARESEDTQARTIKQVLPNGLAVIVKSNPDSRVLGINVLGKNRSAMEPDGKTGIADFTNRMLLKGTETKSAEQISEELSSIGAEITLTDNPWIPYDDVYTTPSYTFVKFQTIDEFADKGIELFSDIVKNPVFPEEEVEKVRKEMMMVLGRQQGSTRESVRQLFYATLFPEDHPYGKPVMGTQRTIGMITSEDLVSFHKKFYAPNNMVMAVVTNIPANEMMEKIKGAFRDMSKVALPTLDILGPGGPTGTVKAHEAMEKEQVYIYVGRPLPGIFSADVPALKVMNSILSSRLALNLREKQGLAYSVGSSIDFVKHFGWFVASIGTRPQNYQVAVDGILAEMDEMKQELVSPEELEKAKNGIWGNMLFYRLSRVNQAYFMSVNEFKEVGYDYDDKYIEHIRQVTASQVKQAAEKYLDTENYVLGVVGKT
jgi:zinc protease